MKNDIKRQRATNSQVDRVISDMRQLRAQNKTDNEIRALLVLELRTYQRYTKQIHEEDKAIWFGITKIEMEQNYYD